MNPNLNSLLRFCLLKETKVRNQMSSKTDQFLTRDSEVSVSIAPDAQHITFDGPYEQQIYFPISDWSRFLDWAAVQVPLSQKEKD